MSRNIEKDSLVHAIKRGARGLPIVIDDDDRWRFLRMLFYLNDQNLHENWTRDVLLAGAKGHAMPWPAVWEEREPLVRIHAYILMSNHFHLLLEEIKEGGISEFMRNVSDSMTKSFNKKNKEKGSLFQGPHKSQIITDDNYLKFVFVYILIKNSFELYPEGFISVYESFNKAFDWVLDYPFCSLADFIGTRKSSPIVEGFTLTDLFEDKEEFLIVAREALAYSREKKSTKPWCEPQRLTPRENWR